MKEMSSRKGKEEVNCASTAEVRGSKNGLGPWRSLEAIVQFLVRFRKAGARDGVSPALQRVLVTSRGGEGM